jgi:hypothetical protein
LLSFVVGHDVAAQRSMYLWAASFKECDECPHGSTSHTNGATTMNPMIVVCLVLLAATVVAAVLMLRRRRARH